MRLPLTAQVLILVLLPLVLQLGSLVWLASLESEAESELRKANQAKKISDAVNQLSNDVFYALAMHGNEEADFQMPESGVLKNLKSKLKDHYGELKRLTSSDPELYAVVVRAETAGYQTMNLLMQLDRSFRRSEIGEHDQRKKLWKQLRKPSKNLLSKELMSLGRQQKRFADSSPHVQADLRQKIQNAMVLAGGVNLLLTLFAAFYLTQEIGNKIRRLNDNTYRLAADKPLHPPLPGSDELSRLDQVFHEMAADLKAARRKERSLIDNARDLICSINSSGKLSAVNPYCQDLLGYKPDELLLSNFSDIVCPASLASCLNYLDAIKDGADETALETQLLDRMGNRVDVLISSRYSRDDDSFFLVVHDITERQEAERLRQEVVAMVTHDLRTPLNTLGNIFEFIAEGSLGELSAKGMKFVDSGTRNVKRMTALVNDLLDIEKFRAGKVELDISDVSLKSCLEACRDLHLGISEEEGVEVDIQGEDIVVQADREKLERLFSNLLANALKFTPRGGMVTMALESRDQEVVVLVEDDGPGLEADSLEHIFDRFFQVPGSAKKALGSGLGLSIARAVAEAHGFRLWAEVPRERGGRFLLSISP